jgi:hypothetical protein
MRAAKDLHVRVYTVVDVVNVRSDSLILLSLFGWPILRFCMTGDVEKDDDWT